MHKYLPSRKLTILLLIVVIGIGLFFIFRVATKQRYTAEMAQQKLDINKLTVNALTQADADGDGIPDWQESLWGTDKNKVATFDGVPDATYIENKKKELQRGSEAGAQNQDLTETEKFSRQFLASFAAMKASGQVDQASINNFASSLGQNLVSQTLPNPYSEKDIKVSTKDDAETKANYYDAVKTLYDGYRNAGVGDELNIVNDALVSYSAGTTVTELDKLTAIANAYETFGKKVIKMTVPPSLVSYHLDIANGAINTGLAVLSMTKIVNDPVVGLAGISEYQKYSDQLAQAASDLADNVSADTTAIDSADNLLQE